MERVAIIGGTRTPFVKAGSAFAKHTALDMAKHSVTSLVKKLELKPDGIDELIYSSVLLDPRLPNFAREIVLRTDLPNSINAHFVSNNCISGLVALNFLSDGIKTGRIKCGIGGGVESMSLPTLTMNPKGERWFINLSRARSMGQKLSLLAKFRPGFLAPRPPSPKEPSTGLTMGQHMEITAQKLAIPRAEQDKIAYNSHINAAQAQSSNFLAEEISALDGVAQDNIIRANTSIEKLATLKPVFERSDKGTLTAGNSSPLTDGASAVCLMSESRAKAEGRKILAFIEAIEFSAVDPNDGLLMAPALALPRLLRNNNLKVSDIDLFEIHEAFAAQVLANMQAWEQGFLGEAPIGRLDQSKVNINGGSIAIGHPFAATGGRLITSLAHSLQRNGADRGVISVCAAGAMAAAVLLSKE